ncbi:histidine kinase [Massilia sp. H-1]|nr:histidine kinase [Massilia sp. H-1]
MTNNIANPACIGAHCDLAFQPETSTMKQLAWPSQGVLVRLGHRFYTYNFLRAIFGMPLTMNFVFNAAHFGTWALLGVLALPVIRARPLRMHWESWIFHIVFGSLLTQIDVTIGHWLFAALTPAYSGASMLDLFFIAFEDCFHLGFLTYLGFVGVVQGFDTLRQARMNELQVAEHKAAYVHAQLQSLKLQLQPHFLFNTLHAIGSLMHYDVPTADRMLSRLSEMLRTSLRRIGQSGRHAQAGNGLHRGVHRYRKNPLRAAPGRTVGNSRRPAGKRDPALHPAAAGRERDQIRRGAARRRRHDRDPRLRRQGVADAGSGRRCASPVGAAEGFRYRLEQHAPAPGRAVWRGTEFRAGAPCRGHGRAHPHSPSDAGGGMSGTIRVLVADDETSARKRLIQFLGAHADVALADEARNGLEACEQIARLQPDLVFLDVEMPELSGLEVVHKIGTDNMLKPRSSPPPTTTMRSAHSMRTRWTICSSPSTKPVSMRL